MIKMYPTIDNNGELNKFTIMSSENDPDLKKAAEDLEDFLNLPCNNCSNLDFDKEDKPFCTKNLPIYQKELCAGYTPEENE